MNISSESGEIRIVVISDAVPERNGVGSYYADLLEKVRPQVAAAELVHPDHPETGGVAWISIPLPGDRTQRLRMPHFVRLYKYLKRLQPTVVVIPTPGPFGLAGLAWSKHHQTPVIAGFHTHYEALADLYWRKPTSRIFGKLCQFCLSCSNRLLFRQAAQVLANAPETRNQALELGATKVELMGTSVASVFLSVPLVPLRDIGPQDRPRVLFAGRLAAEKCIDRLLEVVRQRSDLHFTIAGDGPLRKQLENLAQGVDNLEYLGWVRRESMVDLLDSADLFVLPSAVESFGTVALEALARARPTLVSENCGIAEWSEFRPALHTFESSESLQHGIDRVLSLPREERQRRADIGRQAACALDRWNASNWLQRMRRVSPEEVVRPAGSLARSVVYQDRGMD